MPAPEGFTQVYSGFTEVGDFIYNSGIAVWIEVTAESSFLGHPVRNHKQVWRDPHKAYAQRLASTVVKSHTDLCDELQEFDGVSLREGGFYDNHRMVVYKDDQYIYLRKLSNQPGSQTSDRVCRRTGKVWKWTAGGWELFDAVLVESPILSKNLNLNATIVTGLVGG